MNSYWTQTTTYGDTEIKWEYKEATTEEETYVFVYDE